MVSSATGRTLRSYSGSAANEFFGTGTREISDIDGDGYRDLFVGAAFDSTGGNLAGKFTIQSGLDGHQLFAAAGTRAEATLGARGVSAGDVDGDGRIDLAVSAPTDPGGGLRAGRVYMILGSSFAKTEAPRPLLFHPTPPCRVLDTRGGSGPIGSGQFREFPIAGLCGVPPQARAVSANFTVTKLSGSGFLSIYPENGPLPRAVSTLNFDGGRWALANGGIVPLRGDGGITAFAASSSLDLIVDVNGYFSDGEESGGLQFHPLAPCRTHDSREEGGILAPEQPRSWIVGGRCGVPEGAGALSGNLTVTGMTSIGYVNIYPEEGAPVRVSSILNFSADQWALANAAVVPLRSGGALTINMSGSPAHALFDTNGFFGSTLDGGLRFFPLVPCRLFDTRETAPLGSGDFRSFQAAGICGVPADASAIVGNVTVTNIASTGYLSAYTNDGPPAAAVSTINFAPAQWALANAAIIPLRAGGLFNMFAAGSRVDVLFDVSGYFR